MNGPLSGIKVLELGALGPAPFAGSVLADFGADVLRIDRPHVADLGIKVEDGIDVYNRNKRSVAVDLKTTEGKALVLSLVEKADVLIEGFRPKVVDRLGLDPKICLQRNAKLVYAHMTGWGQSGPLAQIVGHDINYLGLTGALFCIGEKGRKPMPPLNLAADLGGGAMYMVAGVLAAIIEARQSGQGQVIDVAMVDGVANLMSAFYYYHQQGSWSNQREDNFVDGGAPFYRTYETLDGKFLAVGAIEARFYRALINGMGLKVEDLPDQNERSSWPEINRLFESIFKSKTRSDWLTIMQPLDACCTAVLDIDEAMTDTHMQARQTFSQLDGLLYPSPAPRFNRTPATLRCPPPTPGQHSVEALCDWGIARAAVDELLSNGSILQHSTD